MEFEIDKVVTAETDTERCSDLHGVPVEDMEALLHDRIVSEYRGEAWKDMRRQWGVNDAKRDGDKTLSDDVEIYADLDYKTSGFKREGFGHVKEYASVQSGNISGNKSDYASNSRFDIYKPVKPGAYPTLVNIHGGGFFYGDKEIYKFYCADMARRGFNVVNFNYRLSPENKYPANIEDVCACMNYLKENADELDLDMDKVFLTGDSAGAYLSVLYCVLAGDKKLRDKVSFATSAVMPRAVALNCGVYDQREDPGSMLFWTLFNSDGSLAAEKADSVIFLDTLTYMDGTFPPAYVMTSVNDGLKSRTDSLISKFKEKNVRFTYREYGAEHPENGHVFHIDVTNPEAVECNDAEAEFFKRFI